MAKASDQFRPSDVTFWGVVALICCGAAVLSANLAALVPAGVFAGLHASRADGGTIGQLRSQVLDLAAESVRLRRENNVLLQRFTLAEQARNEVTRRVGALEVSVPALLERGSPGAGIDRSVTASIGEEPPQSFEAEGGFVEVKRRPLVTQPVADGAVPEAAVQPPAADDRAFGISLGFPVEWGEAEAQWHDLASRVGTLLLGLAPLLQDTGSGDGTRLVAGPLQTSAEAEALCGRLDLVGVPCQPTRFTGEPLPLLN